MWYHFRHTMDDHDDCRARVRTGFELAIAPDSPARIFALFGSEGFQSSTMVWLDRRL